jgi:hypothetical protein
MERFVHEKQMARMGKIGTEQVVYGDIGSVKMDDFRSVDTLTSKNLLIGSLARERYDLDTNTRTSVGGDLFIFDHSWITNAIPRSKADNNQHIRLPWYFLVSLVNGKEFSIPDFAFNRCTVIK